MRIAPAPLGITSLAVTLVALFAVLLPLSRPARADRWTIAAGDEQTVGFHSTAPLESFDGTTHNVEGMVTLDAAALGEEITIEVQVDMASLDTGVSMRNRHMRQNHLHTDRYPHGVFSGGRVVEGGGVDLRDGADHDVTIEGSLNLHGVKQPVTLTLSLRLEPPTTGNTASPLRVRADFPVALKDHKIRRPRFLFAKLGEVQRVYVDVLAEPVVAVQPSTELPADSDGSSGQ